MEKEGVSDVGELIPEKEELPDVGELISEKEELPEISELIPNVETAVVKADEQTEVSALQTETDEVQNTEDIEIQEKDNIEEKLKNIDTNFLFCTKCGKKNKGEHSFCIKCGAPLKKPTENRNNQNTQAYRQYNINNNVPQNYNYPSPNQNVRVQNVQNKNTFAQQVGIMDYVGTNRRYYAMQFQKIDAMGGADFHVPAFFLGIFWLFYRKMYIYGAVYAVVVMIAVLIPYIGCFISLGLYVALGLNASKIYKQHLEKLVDECNSLPKNARAMHVQKNGGTLF